MQWPHPTGWVFLASLSFGFPCHAATTVPGLITAQGNGSAGLSAGCMAAQELPERQWLSRGIEQSANVRRALGAAALAKARLELIGGWRASVDSVATAAQDAQTPDLSLDLVASVHLELPGRTADPARFEAAQVWHRTQLDVTLARRAAWSSRVGLWNDVARAWAAQGTSCATLHWAQLADQAARARLAQGVGTALQVELTSLERDRALAQVELGVTRVALYRARLDASVSLSATAAWLPLPLPPLDALVAPSNVTEQQLALDASLFALGQAQRDARPKVVGTGRLVQGRFEWSGALSSDGQGSLDGSIHANTALVPAGWSLGLRATVNLDQSAQRTASIEERTVMLSRDALQSSQEEAAKNAQLLKQALEAALTELRLMEKTLEVQRGVAELDARRLQQGLIGEVEAARDDVSVAIAAQAVTDARWNVDQATLAFWDALGWLPPLEKP